MQSKNELRDAIIQLIDASELSFREQLEAYIAARPEKRSDAWMFAADHALEKWRESRKPLPKKESK